MNLLHGTALVEVGAEEFCWTFSFSGGATVVTQSMWRALAAGGIAVTSEDHHQTFGLPAPVDAGQRAISVLPGKIMSVEIAPTTCDLRINFESESSLEFLNTSCGYEGWHLRAPENGKVWEIVALGGGDVAMW